MLSSSQRADMAERSHDVDELVDILQGCGRDADRETAYQAWSDHSDSSSASWLVFDAISSDSRSEIRAAYDHLMLGRAEQAIASAVPEHRRDDVYEAVAAHLGLVSAAAADPSDLRIVRTHDRSVIGTMAEDHDAVTNVLDLLVDRFDVELDPETARVHATNRILSAFGVEVVDRDGYAV